MTRAIDRIAEVARDYDVTVLDQWGVLHDGSAPYPGAVAALEDLRAEGHRLAVLSNSGKRAAPNRARIAALGFRPDLFETVMTSGEALWRDVRDGRIPARRFHPIERAPGDAAHWAEGLQIDLCGRLAGAEAILLMGLPDGSGMADWQGLLNDALAEKMPVYCSNPDRASPRARGQIVISPGALAHAYQESGGQVVFYGKPHRPIFDSLRLALNATRLLMVGDSLEHDIAGADAAGWDSVLCQGGLYAPDFASGDGPDVLRRLCAEKNTPAPTYRIELLR